MIGIFTDIYANKDMDGFVHSVSLFIRVNQITRGAGTGSTLQTVSTKVPDLNPISGYQRLTRPSDMPPDLGQ